MLPATAGSSGAHNYGGSAMSAFFATYLLLAGALIALVYATFDDGNGPLA
jgi:hypothetical protein